MSRGTLSSENWTLTPTQFSHDKIPAVAERVAGHDGMVASPFLERRVREATRR